LKISDVLKYAGLPSGYNFCPFALITVFSFLHSNSPFVTEDFNFFFADYQFFDRVASKTIWNCELKYCQNYPFY
jgi:hypothetical protein